ncbi:hypothetical protein NW762_000876 [Fusarium torreyae]|uniref:BTB domain-containing protein n=1 Tax=Fusarium torreyae TaxID=1237075 RepID=A0A9W8VQR6_9HYPO|nr:hypothetical protein NW762_000876 [Fusarium torreyae]
MSSPFLEKIRSAYPSRQAIMGFLNNDGTNLAASDSANSESLTSEPEIVEPEAILPATREPPVSTPESTISYHTARGPTTEEASISECATNEPKARELANTETSSYQPAICQPSITITEPMASEPEKPAIRFDPNGDLRLEIGKDPVRYMIVDSRALCRCSGKLQTMLTQSSKENDDCSMWTVSLPGDDPAPFALLLNLIHARFEKIPAQVSVNQLYGVCILTNKYEMTEVLRPVAERWYKGIQRPEISELFFKMLFVAWELGFAEDMSQMTGQIVYNCWLDEDNQLAIGNSWQNLTEIEALQRVPILDCIEEHRSLALEVCWEECQKLSETVLSFSVEGSWCESHTQRDVYLMLGRMMSKAEREGIIDLFSPLSIFEFCQSLRLSLSELETKIRAVADFVDVCGWCSGVFEMVDEIRSQCRRTEDPLYLHHLEALKAQAAKVEMVPWVSDSDQE